MSISELKHSLRKYEFPTSAKEALSKIEQVLIGRGAPSSKQIDIAMEIISEFVFCEFDRRGNRRGGGLTPLQELQLIDIICDYLCACSNDTTKNTIFLSLFGSIENQKKLKILSILASMAISASSIPVLLAIGVWLQQTGCSSPNSLQLVENVIRDHFYLNTSNQAALRALANTAPQFIANFMTTVTELYMHDAQTSKAKPPPKNLLEIMTAWVYSNPTLCMSAQLNAAALPSGSIPMAAVTPLAGLVRWCSLAPLNIDEDTEILEIPIKKIKLEDEKPHLSVPVKCLSESELYTKLHLGVLISMRAGRRSHGPPTALNAQHLVALTQIIQNYTQRTAKKSAYKVVNDFKLQDCLDRLGQAVQVALSHGCVYGNINILLAALENLPENRLIRIIVKSHRQTL